MKKRQVTPIDIEIDATYESRVSALENMAPGSVSDYTGNTTIEPARPHQPIVQRQTYVQSQSNNGSEAAHKLITAVMQPQPTQELDSAFAPMPGTHDATNAKDRATALNTKMGWQVAMLGGAGLAILLVCLAVGFWVEHPNTGFFVGAVVALTFIYVVGSKRLNQMIANDNEYSREGTERHRIDRAVDVQLARMEHDATIKKMALAAVLKQLGVRDGNDY